MGGQSAEALPKLLLVDKLSHDTGFTDLHGHGEPSESLSLMSFEAERTVIDSLCACYQTPKSLLPQSVSSTSPCQ